LACLNRKGTRLLSNMVLHFNISLRALHHSNGVSGPNMPAQGQTWSKDEMFHVQVGAEFSAVARGPIR
jgi:hypothetical protein